MSKKITFLKNYKVKAADGDEYVEGETYELSDESAQHFVSRGLAVDPKQAAALRKAKADEAAAEAEARRLEAIEAAEERLAEAEMAVEAASNAEEKKAAAEELKAAKAALKELED